MKLLLYEKFIDPTQQMKDVLVGVLNDKLSILRRNLHNMKDLADAIISPDSLMHIQAAVDDAFSDYGIFFMPAAFPLDYLNHREYFQRELDSSGIGSARINGDNRQIEVEYDPVIFARALVNGRLTGIFATVGHEMIHRMQLSLMDKTGRTDLVRAKRADRLTKAAELDGDSSRRHSAKMYYNDPMEVMAWAWTYTNYLYDLLGDADKTMKCLRDPMAVLKDIKSDPTFISKISGTRDQYTLEKLMSGIDNIIALLSEHKRKKFYRYCKDYLDVVTASGHKPTYTLR